MISKIFKTSQTHDMQPNPIYPVPRKDYLVLQYCQKTIYTTTRGTISTQRKRKHVRRGKETIPYHCVVPIAFLVQTWPFNIWKMIFLKGFGGLLYKLQLIIVVMCRVSERHVCRVAIWNKGEAAPNTSCLHPCKLKPFWCTNRFLF